MWILNYADGETYLLEVSEKSGYDIFSLQSAVKILLKNDLIKKVGKNVKDLKEGDKVIVTWVGKNSYKGKLDIPQTTASYKGVKFSEFTFTWSQYTIVDENLVVKIDSSHPDDVSSIVGCAVLTGGGAVLHTAKVRPNNSVAIYGMGGVGLSALKMAHLLNAYPIIAVDIIESKLQFAKEFGATHIINSMEEDPIQKIHEITNGGVDYAFDATGNRTVAEQILSTTKSGGPGAENLGGTAILIGPPGREITLDPRLFIGGHRTYRGSYGATYPEVDIPAILSWFEQGKLPIDKIVTKQYSIDNINEACHQLEKGNILGRAIIVF